MHLDSGEISVQNECNSMLDLDKNEFPDEIELPSGTQLPGFHSIKAIHQNK